MCNLPGFDQINHFIWRVAMCVPCRCRKRLAQTYTVSFSITRAYKGPPPVTRLCATCRVVIISTIPSGVLRFASRVGAASAAQTSAENNSHHTFLTGATSGHPPMCNMPGCDQINHFIWRVAICVPCRCRKRCADLRCEQ